MYQISKVTNLKHEKKTFSRQRLFDVSVKEQPKSVSSMLLCIAEVTFKIYMICLMTKFKENKKITWVTSTIK